MLALALSRPRTVVSGLVVGLGLAGCLAILSNALISAGLILALALCALAANLPRFVPLYLLLICTLQPLVLRIAASSEYVFLVRHLDEFSLLILLPWALFHHAASGRPLLPVRTIVALAFVVTIGLAASLTQRTSTYLVLLDGFLLLKGVLFFAVVTACPLDRGNVSRLLNIALVVALVAAGLGLLHVAAPGLLRGLLGLEEEGTRFGMVTLVSIFDNEGQSGWYFACCAAVCYAFYWIYRKNGLLGLFGLFSLCALLTLRRKPIAGLVIVLLVSVILNRQVFGRLKGLVVAGSVILAAFLAFGDTIRLLVDQGYEIYVATRDPSRVARNAMYLASFRLAVENFPLGVGFGLFGGFASQLSYSPIYYEQGLSRIWGLSPNSRGFMLDAFWPHILGQFGFFGLTAFLGTLGTIWGPIARRLGLLRDPFAQALALAALLTFFEAFVESTASPVFESTLSSYYIFGLAGLATAYRGEEPGPAEPATER